jgi:RNA polymerase sigma factor (TIGR02999 family)
MGARTLGRAKIAASGLAPDVLAACYSDMRRMARRIIAGDSAGRLLQPTELANEAAIRMIRAYDLTVNDQGHLLAMAARTMRRVLIDEARKGAASKRSEPTFHTLWPDEGQGQLISIDDLDRALIALEAFSPEHARIVELRFMLGMTVEETAAAMNLAERTVKRRWQAARVWLLDHLTDHDDKLPATPR